MDLAAIWEAIAKFASAVPHSTLLIATVAAVVASWIGSAMVARSVPLGRLIRSVGSIALLMIFVAVVLQVSRFDPRFGMAVPQLGLPEQVVEGGETRIPISRDGHYWIQADVNGSPVPFLVDTGATLTAVSARTAQRVGLEARPGGIPIMLNTANGTITAEIGTIDELRFGNVVARGLDIVIAPGLGETNVIGMNLLSRLASWRVEGQTLILVPNNPQPVAEGSF
ncbi:TIGR02281 family clan AA aspartic protease [Leptolyngbya sp. 15MV]|nr:TIGR02281 family clan AA aspartic protease [Leptolyngbya sp. 15MV]